MMAETANMKMQAKPKSNNVHLITFNDNQSLTFFGRCKLCINVLSKYLIVEPFDESIKMISVSFDQLMIKRKNILCVCSAVSDFVLIFKDKQMCNKVLNCIQQHKTQTHELLENEIQDSFLQQFFIPILEATETNSDLKEIITNFMESLKPIQRKEISKLLKDMNRENLIFWQDYLTQNNGFLGNVEFRKTLDMGNVNQKNVQNLSSKRSLRKRKFVDYQNLENVEIVKEKENSSLEIVSKKLRKSKPKPLIQSTTILHQSIQNTVIKKPNFKLETYKTSNLTVRNLVVYTSAEFSDDVGSKLCYNFCGEKNRNTFRCIGCAKLKKKTYAKLFLNLNGEERVEMSKTHICKPHSEEKTLPSTEFQLQSNDKKLLIFDSEERTLCYEYYFWGKNIYICRGCDKLNSFYCTVRIYNNDGKNYAKIFHGEHICKPIKYESTEKETIVKLPNFKIDKFQDQCKVLVVYEPNNQNLCYNYIWSGKGIFDCYECRYKHTHVVAKLRQEENGEPYVELNLLNHICKPHPEEKIVRNILVQCNERKVVIPLEDSNLCYEYVRQKFNTYRCRECCRTQFHSNIWLFGNAKDGYYAKIVDEKHACKPIKFEPNEKKTIIQKPFYKTERFVKNGIETKSLVVYDQENPKLCYNYSYMNSKKHFRCSKCHNLKAFVIANLRKDKNGKEFVELSLSDHVCKLLPEERTISPNEFHIQNDGKNDPKLFIFDSNDKSLCFEFFAAKGNIYRCRMCTMAIGSQLAKLFLNDSDEYYVKIDKGKHICKPLETKKVIKSRNN